MSHINYYKNFLKRATIWNEHDIYQALISSHESQHIIINLPFESGPYKIFKCNEVGHQATSTKQAQDLPRINSKGIKAFGSEPHK
jgi:hypothetical protein